MPSACRNGSFPSVCFDYYQDVEERQGNKYKAVEAAEWKWDPTASKSLLAVVPADAPGLWVPADAGGAASERSPYRGENCLHIAAVYGIMHNIMVNKAPPRVASDGQM
eukprot:gene12354-2253_t